MTVTYEDPSGVELGSEGNTGLGCVQMEAMKDVRKGSLAKHP